MEKGLGEVLIPVVNRLHDAVAALGAHRGRARLDLPQVAVVGGQSSGKSSVLEALVGRDFLPRGPEICTRRPLVLQLVQCPPGQTEHGEFLHLPGQRFYNFARVREEIQLETDRGAGTGKAVTNAPIRLRICSPNVLTMTLVDLPGITKVPVGDQPSNIEEQIRAMIHDYIKHPSCIILAVHPANQDLANSDALMTAKAVDPDGVRTIGVLTKLDIMDRGTDAARALRGEVVPLRLGYVAVVNRCQADIDENRSIREARAAEMAFFEGHPGYREQLARCGVERLAVTLNRILVQHIKLVLPDLRANLQKSLTEKLLHMQSLGEGAMKGARHAQGGLILRLLKDYAEALVGDLDGSSETLDNTEIAGGARIRHIFQDIFVKGLRDIDLATEVSDEEIRTAIVNCSGVKGSLLMPELPFEVLVKRLIATLEDPVLQCARFVKDELVQIAHRCEPREIARFPKLQRAIAEAVEEFVRAGTEPTEAMLRGLIQCEMGHINTAHPAFVGGSKAIQRVLEGRKAAAADGEGDEASDPPAGVGLKGLESLTPLDKASHDLLTPQRGPRPDAGAGDGAAGSGWFAGLMSSGAKKKPSHGRRLSVQASPVNLDKPARVLHVEKPRNEQEQLEVDVTRLLVASYFGIVVGNLQDLTPKVIMNFMVNKIKKTLQQNLVHSLYKEELFDGLTEEHESIASQRKQCHDAVQVLTTAIATLDAVPKDLWALIEGDRASSKRKEVEAAFGEVEATAGPTSVGGTPRFADRLRAAQKENVAERTPASRLAPAVVQSVASKVTAMTPGSPGPLRRHLQNKTRAGSRGS